MKQSEPYQRPLAYYEADRLAHETAMKSLEAGIPLADVVRELRQRYSANLALHDSRAFKAVNRLKAKAEAGDLGAFARRVLAK